MQAAGIEPKNATPAATTGYVEPEPPGGTNSGTLAANSADLIGLAKRLLELSEADRAKLLRLLAGEDADHQ